MALFSNDYVWCFNSSIQNTCNSFVKPIIKSRSDSSCKIDV